MGASQEQEEPLWSEVDCEELWRLEKELGVLTKLKDLSVEDKERLFPRMRPTKVQINESKKLLQYKGGGLYASTVLPSVYLPPYMEKKTLGTLAIEKCDTEGE